VTLLVSETFRVGLPSPPRMIEPIRWLLPESSDTVPPAMQATSSEVGAELFGDQLSLLSQLLLTIPVHDRVQVRAAAGAAPATVMIAPPRATARAVRTAAILVRGMAGLLQSTIRDNRSARSAYDRTVTTSPVETTSARPTTSPRAAATARTVSSRVIGRPDDSTGAP